MSLLNSAGDRPPLIVASRYLANGFKAEPGWPSDGAANEADRLTDAEWKKTARFDDGSTFTSRDYRVQFLARLVEDEWSKAGAVITQRAPVTAKPDLSRALALVGELAVELRRVGGM